MAKKITLLMDGRTPVEVDEEEFELIKLMVQEVGAHLDFFKISVVTKNLVAQGYQPARARELCILARSELNKKTPS